VRVTTHRTVLVPAGRVVRFFDNFVSRHGVVALRNVSGRFVATAGDGSSASAALPFGGAYFGAADPAAFAAAVAPPALWGILLVRRGGFAVALVSRDEVQESKVGQRHVQGRTKAGGQSQLRFARRRDNQAREAFEAAADHASRILLGRPAALVCGGDRQAVELVLSDPRLRHLTAVRVDPWLPVPDPRRSVLDQAILDAASVSIEISEPD
jgi:hypothetical protein